MKALRESGATIMIGLGTRYRLLLAAGWQGDPNLQLTIGGEVLSIELARQLAERSRALWNHFGPTETSICARAGPFEQEQGRSRTSAGGRASTANGVSRDAPAWRLGLG